MDGGPIGAVALPARAIGRAFLTPSPAAEVEEQRRRVLAGIVALGGGALAMTLAARWLATFPGDELLTRRLQEYEHPLVDRLMRAVSAPGYGALSWSTTLAATGALWALGRRRQALFTGLTITADWLNALIKFVIQRPRPAEPRVRVRRRHRARSFPSGHVMHYTALYGFLLYLTLTELPPSAGRAVLAGALASVILAVGPSRVYLGAHWSSDVVAGYVIGAIWLGLLILLYVGTPAALSRR